MQDNTHPRANVSETTAELLGNGENATAEILPLPPFSLYALHLLYALHAPPPVFGEKPALKFIPGGVFSYHPVLYVNM